jgi:UDPglucose 6-dehydrogenase
VGAPQSVVEVVIAANAATQTTLARRVIDYFGGSLAGKTIGVLGVAFKQQTDDMREAPALTIIPALQAAGARIQAFDPAAMNNAKPMLPGVLWMHDMYDPATQADAIVVLTEWNEFRGLDLDRLAAAMNAPVMFDFRNLYKLDEVDDTPFTYLSLGRPMVKPARAVLRSVKTVPVS